MKNLKLSHRTKPLSYTVLTVSQLNEQIREVLNTSFKNSIWVCGEIYRYDLDISKANIRSSRQVYFELVEQNPVTKERKATISAVIWGDDRDIIDAKLKQSNAGFILADGLQVKVQCYVDFYPPQGKVQIRIVDIDLEYTVGKMALERKQLLEKLKKLGLLERNKKIPLPIIPLHIGLITSFGSAAYNDFIDELKKSGYGFHVYLCDAKMQGGELESDVCMAISKLSEIKNIDVITIIRGGGSASDLMGFDKENVAIAIANSTKPILTGIGHQIDKTVSDEVANQSFKTPTATAQFLVKKIENFQTETENIFNQIMEKQKIIIINTENTFFNTIHRTQTRIQLISQKHYNTIMSLNEKINWTLKNIFRYNYNLLDDSFKQISLQNLRNFILKKYEMLDQFEKLKNSKDPGNIIKLGFSIIYAQNNKVVKSINHVSIGENIKAEVIDGEISGTVISKERRKKQN